MESNQQIHSIYETIKQNSSETGQADIIFEMAGVQMMGEDAPNEIVNEGDFWEGHSRQWSSLDSVYSITSLKSFTLSFLVYLSLSSVSKVYSQFMLSFESLLSV